MEVACVTKDRVSGLLDPWGSFDLMVGLPAVAFPHLARGISFPDDLGEPGQFSSYSLEEAHSNIWNILRITDVPKGVLDLLQLGPWRSLRKNSCICLKPFWRRVCVCLAPCSSLKCQKMRNASQHEGFQTHMWQEIWHQLYKCQMSRIKQYGYSISSAILVPCAWACSIRKTAFQLWVIALLALGVHVWKYSWVTN